MRPAHLRLWMRVLVGKHPSVFFPLYGLRPRNRPLAVSRETELVIEGFPRSANTFAVVAFRLSQDRPVRLAHHLHMPAQIIRAARLGRPTLVLAREPRDAILSFLVRDPALSPSCAVAWYRSFHEAVLAHREQVVVALFRDAVDHFGEVVDRVNRRFGTAFRRYEASPAMAAAVREEIDRLNRRFTAGSESTVARPSPVKEAQKAKLRHQLEEPRLARDLSSIERLYDQVTRRSGVRE